MPPSATARSPDELIVERSTVRVPEALRVVKLPAAAVVAPMTVPSMVPPFRSTVVTVPRSLQVPVKAPPPVALRVVTVAAAGVVPPTTVLSIVPPLISAVVNTEEARVTIPVVSAMEPAALRSLAWMFVTSMLVISKVVAFTAVALMVTRVGLQV